MCIFFSKQTFYHCGLTAKKYTRLTVQKSETLTTRVALVVYYLEIKKKSRFLSLLGKRNLTQPHASDSWCCATPTTSLNRARSYIVRGLLWWRSCPCVLYGHAYVTNGRFVRSELLLRGVRTIIITLRRNFDGSSVARRCENFVLRTEHDRTNEKWVLEQWTKNKRTRSKCAWTTENERTRTMNSYDGWQTSLQQVLVLPGLGTN